MNCSYQIEISEHQIRPLAAFIPAQQRRLRYQFKIPSSLVQSSSIEPNNLAFHTTVNSLKLIVRFAIYGSICKIEPAKGDNPSVKYFIIPPPCPPLEGDMGEDVLCVSAVTCCGIPSKHVEKLLRISRISPKIFWAKILQFPI